jgi:hypothetical protein
LQQLTDDIKDVLAECYGSLAVAAKVLFPERFFREFDPIHYQIFEAIERSNSRYVALAAPRGLGKTSINNLLLPATSALFQKYNYIVPVSCSATMAQQQSENLKRELVENPLIKKLFGDVRTNSFSKEQWVVRVGSKDICVMPRGAGQQVRGMLFGNSRPDLIIVDDLEDPENMDSEEQRAKKKEWFFGSLLNCVDRGSKNWRIVVLGTVLHQDSLLVNLLDDPKWHSVSLEICDDNFKSKAPNFMSDEEIKELFELYESQGKVDTFYREYRNLPVATGAHATFKQEYFRYHDELEANLSANRNVENVVIIDPAKTVKLESADSVILGVGLDMVADSIYVRDCVAEKLYPDQLYEELANMIIRLNARVLAVEVTSLHEFILHPIKNELARRNIHVEIIELHARAGKNEKGKIERIRQLVQYYRLGLISHNKAVTGKLETQLLSFPRSKLWDVMDALGYVPEILERGERYMRGYDGRTEDAKEVESEYTSLYDEDDEHAFSIEDFRSI